MIFDIGCWMLDVVVQYNSCISCNDLFSRAYFTHEKIFESSSCAVRVRVGRHACSKIKSPQPFMLMEREKLVCWSALQIWNQTFFFFRFAHKFIEHIKKTGHAHEAY